MSQPHSYQLQFLGTSSGVPTRHRNVSALAVSLLGRQQTMGKDTPWILVDCGEATQHQLMNTKLRPKNLIAILITHVHGDHCYGLPGLLASLAMHGRKQPLTIIAPKAIHVLMQSLIELTQLTLSYPITWQYIEDLSDEYLIRLDSHWWLGICTTPLRHRCESYAFAITQYHHQRQLRTQKLTQLGIENRLWGKILHCQDKMVELGAYGTWSVDELRNDKVITNKIVIAGDNDEPNLLDSIVVGAKALVHEATYTAQIKQKILDKGIIDPMHSSALQVGQFASQANVPMLILTHFSARFALFDEPDNPSPNMGHIRTEVESVYDGQLVLANDFDVIMV